RVEQKKSWQETGGHADTTEAAERCIVLASRYAIYPSQVAEYVSSNCVLTQADESIVALTTAYNCILSQLVAGEKLTPELSNKLMNLVHTGELPFHAVTKDNLEGPRRGDPDPPRAGRFSSPDALLTPGFVAEAAFNSGIKIDPAWKVSLVYGMPCAIYHLLPAA